MNSKTKNKKLSMFSVAIMYVGTIMGAGFASGREIWQFFGVFGDKGYIGIGLIAILFVIFGLMTAYIARKLNTNDMGKVIVPSDNPVLIDIFGYFMAFIMFTVLITMSSAAGSIFSQQFGLSKILGGIVLIVFTLLTVLGEFERVSKTFRFIMPVLFVIVITVCVFVTFGDYPMSGITEEPTPSLMAPNWFLAAWIYISYNILAMIPIVATSSINAKDEKTAYFGTMFGGWLLGMLALLLVSTMLTDPGLSQSLDMPMLGLSLKMGNLFNLIYTVVMLFAVFGAATSNYYGFTTKIKNGPKKKWIVIIVAWIGFLCGLFGFKKVVAYMFPAEGYLGFVIMAMIFFNWLKVYRRKTFEDFGGNSRFAYPENYHRVTAGLGGESILFFHNGKSFLYDTGMAYCHEKLIKNIKEVLGDRKLDYILLSHSHYDHIGALPYVLKAYPDAVVCGASKVKDVFNSEGAIDTIIKLGKVAMVNNKVDVDISSRDFRIDRILEDEIEGIKVIHTPGHTDCSLSFYILKDKFLFTSESTGVLVNKDFISTSILKSYDESIKSAKKLKELDVEYLYSPHYGLVPKDFNYLDKYIEAAGEVRNFILSRKGMDEEQLIAQYVEEFYHRDYELDHPRAAFELNAKYIIRNMY
ncbi:MAG: MBL fold metallo-hydrolase [Clostridia bacterium]|nr:MBL fold metallo-hydrolase [Clostridia bacterium]